METFYFKAKKVILQVFFTKVIKIKLILKFLVQILVKINWDIIYPTTAESVKTDFISYYSLEIPLGTKPF